MATASRSPPSLHAWVSIAPNLIRISYKISLCNIFIAASRRKDGRVSDNMSVHRDLPHDAKILALARDLPALIVSPPLSGIHLTLHER